ncbi:MAG: hypothetical protein KGR98_00860 [Verrucomicrobia bacterium]|nr:hypothetical protein [Verrucomicrobiota bacterium]MDE3098648.1 hypothetical protein [Verrucomicrobiota bacterium]
MRLVLAERPDSSGLFRFFPRRFPACFPPKPAWFHAPFHSNRNAVNLLQGVKSPIESAPIVIQHTRLDSRRAENALISAVAFADTRS